jgi:WD40 repeat protein
MFRARLLVPAALLLSALALSFARPAAALEECRLLRQPDIQGETIVFVYAGDLWTVPRAGGTARRLTSHEGIERFPKLSPDGKTVAFTAEYDGNLDAYTVPIEGGEPTRLTWHPDVDQVAEWYPDGKSILLRSRRASFIQRFDRFFKVPATGGFEEMLPLPTAGYATFSPTQGRSRSCRLRTTTARGSATGAATRPTSGPTTSPRTSPRRSPTGRAPTSGRCGTGAPSTTARTAAGVRPTSGPTTSIRKRTSR